MEKNSKYKIIIVVAFFLCGAILTSAQEANAPASKDYILAQYDLRPMKIADEKLKNIVDSLVNKEIYRLYGEREKESNDYYVAFKFVGQGVSEDNRRSFLLFVFNKSYNPLGYEKYSGYLPDMKFEVVCITNNPYLENIDGSWKRFNCFFDKTHNDEYVPHAVISEKKNGRWRVYNWLWGLW